MPESKLSSKLSVVISDEKGNLSVNGVRGVRLDEFEAVKSAVNSDQYCWVLIQQKETN